MNLLFAIVFAAIQVGPMQQGRQLVWGDEFNDTVLNTNKWNFRQTMYTKDRLYVNDRRTVRVEDGMLRMLVSYSGLTNRPYMLSQGITTHDTMGWKYGYLEMRARVPFQHGAWPSFWMQSTDRWRQCQGRYLAEIDIFEMFSSTNQLSSQIHKWGQKVIDGKRQGVHSSFNGKFQLNDGSHRYEFKGEEVAKLASDFHVYSMEWTPKELQFFVDGNFYCRFNIDEAHDFDTKILPTMGGFHDYAFIIFNNELFSPASKWKPKGSVCDVQKDLPIRYDIDWIRLWQNAEAGETMKFGREP